MGGWWRQAYDFLERKTRKKNLSDLCLEISISECLTLNARTMVFMRTKTKKNPLQSPSEPLERAAGVAPASPLPDQSPIRELPPAGHGTEAEGRGMKLPVRVMFPGQSLHQRPPPTGTDFLHLWHILPGNQVRNSGSQLDFTSCCSGQCKGKDVGSIGVSFILWVGQGTRGCWRAAAQAEALWAHV